MTTKANPKAVAQVCALRAAGYSLASIATHTNLSVSTVQRYLKKRSVKKGEAMDAMINAAHEQLQHEVTSDEGMRTIFKELVADTTAQVKLAREKSAELLDKLDADDNKSAALSLRGLAAHSTAIKNHADTLRHLLPEPQMDSEELPELVVRVMTEEDVAEMRRQQEEELAIIDGRSQQRKN